MGRSKTKKPTLAQKGLMAAAGPTLAQKELMAAAGLVARNWLVLTETDTELVLVNKVSGRSRRIKKGDV